MLQILRTTLVSALLIAPLSLFAPLEARAQGFFQSLFGFLTPSKPAAPARPYQLPPPDYRYRPQQFPPSYRNSEDDRPQPRTIGPGSYRTLCVRMCDGYYWPINFHSSRREFHRDADICKSSCTSDARLFFHHNTSGDPSTMVDLTGRAYARLPTAFVYRKKLVSGCTCKPAPWSASEIERHRQYAAAEKAETSTQPGPPAMDDPPAETASEPGAASTQPEDQAVASSEPVTPTSEDPDSEAPRQASIDPDSASVAAGAAAAAMMPRGDTVRRDQARDRRIERAARSTYRALNRPRPRPQQKKPTGFFGLGAGNHRWPGD